MADITQPIEIDADDRYRVSISAPIQSFYYEIMLYPPDGDGGFEDGHAIGYGDSAHSQWIGIGAEIKGARVQVCVTQGGNTATSMADIVVRLDIERSPGVVEHLRTWTIGKGLPSGEFKCMTLQFK